MDFTRLDPTEFENLTFDLMQAAGIKRLIWRTPGSDGGRDIEGTYTSTDFSGFYHHQSWYIECKLYSSSVDWPTVWKKIAYADSKGADFLLIVTNSNPSPACETEIANWNLLKSKPLVRFWRGYELSHILDNYPSVAGKYGLLDKHAPIELSLRDLMLEVMKPTQAANVAYGLGLPISMQLEASAALCELISARQNQLKAYGRIVPLPAADSLPDFDWIEWEGKFGNWQEVGSERFSRFSGTLPEQKS